MAHNLLRWAESTRYSMAFSGEVPWHGLGQKVEGLMTAEQALAAAQLDKKVILCPAYAKIEKDNVAQYIEVPDRRITMYEGQNVPLGDVSSGYKVLQNAEAFSFFDEIVKNGEAVYETAGALGNGERVWVLAKLPDDVKLEGESDIKPYLLFLNSHDGKSCMQARLTSVRVVCQNTLNMSLREGAQAFASIHHTGDVNSKVKEAARLMGLTRASMAATRESYLRMIDHKVDMEAVALYVAKLFQVPDVKNEDLAPSMVRRISSFFAAYNGENAYGKAGAGSAFALYNAATFFTDHLSMRKVTAESRFSRTLYGAQASLKDRALELATELVA